MQTISYTSVRAHLAETMAKVCNNHTPVIITRSKAKPVVILSLEDFTAMEETNYLLKNPANAARLLASIEEIEATIAGKKKKRKKEKNK